MGFVPRRMIGEATHLLKLVQAYLDDTDEEGLALAIDWEKAFDRVSWDYYHKALQALGFGPGYSRWLAILTNVDSLPTRWIKANGRRSRPFTIHCGMPQGCPLSPLAFLLVAEGLTRLVNADSEMRGITNHNRT